MSNQSKKEGILESAMNPSLTPITAWRKPSNASLDVSIPILGYEAAQEDLEKIKLVHDEKILEEIIDLADRTFTAVSARDYSRVDIRKNQTGSYVLEINIMPGLGPHSFLPEAARAIHALDYEQLIQNLAENSMKRRT
jgi:hypothetical protein